MNSEVHKRWNKLRPATIPQSGLNYLQQRFAEVENPQSPHNIDITEDLGTSDNLEKRLTQLKRTYNPDKMNKLDASLAELRKPHHNPHHFDKMKNREIRLDNLRNQPQIPRRLQ